MNKTYILPFHKIEPEDLDLVGGKGANLGAMTKAGFPVPPGFCITTHCYKDFLIENQLVDFLFQCIKNVNVENAQPIGRTIREKIRQSPFPKKLEQLIIDALNEAGPNNYYAVRSSATAEDLAFVSFAGQQDTYLNIKGKESIIDAVRNCWASLFTDRAILYRIQNNIDHQRVLMSVIIQKMVLPEVSGIMFTADPVTGHRALISIDASYGLGEALVSGLVSPDIYKFRKDTSQIVQKTIAHKKLAIIPLPGGGTKKVILDMEQAFSPVMDHGQINTLAELGMAIEKYYQHPQDIEWCLEKGDFYIVQSRPITSLFPLPEPLPQDNVLHAYVSFNHFQVMTEPISPLGIDLIRIILSFDRGARDTKDYKYTKSAAGRIYIDLSELLAYKQFRKILPLVINNADGLLSLALTELINRPDFNRQIKKDKKALKTFRSFLRPVVIKTLKNLIYKDPETNIQSIENYIENRISKTAQDVHYAKPGVERLEAIYQAAVFYKDFQNLMPRIAPGLISFKALSFLEQKLLGTSKYVDLIVKGLEGNITTEMGLLVGDLADIVRKSPHLIKELEDPDYKTLFSRLNNLEDHKEFKTNLSAFMTKYGIRTPGEIDIAMDRWLENPEPLAKSIMAIVHTSQEGIHRKDYLQTIEKAKKAAAEFVKEVETRNGKIKAKIISRLIKVLRNVLPIREHPKYLLMRLVFIFKTVLLEEAESLVQKGHLVHSNDVFYVGFWELYKAIESNESLIGIVEQRKEEYQHFKKLTPPRVLTNQGEEIKATYYRDNLPENALAGMAVSSGVIEGIAKVITDPTQDTVNKGEILVAPFTDPGWTPLFINAAGLIMEVGGLLTHGTVVAREYGIPAVVGITDATKLIKTGQLIRVDGDAGFVIVLGD